MYILFIALLVLIPMFFYRGFTRIFAGKPVDKIDRSQWANEPLTAGDNHDKMNSSQVSNDNPKKNILLKMDENQDFLNFGNSMFKSVRSCSMVTETDPSTSNISRIYLELEMLNGAKPVHMHFYDDKLNGLHELPYRARRAKFWNKKIQLELIRNRTHTVLQYTV